MWERRSHAPLCLGECIVDSTAAQPSSGCPAFGVLQNKTSVWLPNRTAHDGGMQPHGGGVSSVVFGLWQH
jgi:hypothetical protein